jgi:hypothetical protein
MDFFVRFNLTLPIYTTYHLHRVVNRLKLQPRFFLNRYFPTEVTHESEEVYFDVVESSEGISPFVHPLHQGKLLTHEGYETKSYKPAYVKEKVVHDAERPLKRLAGEPFGGSLSAEQRMRLHVVLDTERLRERLQNRLEVMATEVCKTGKATIIGEGLSAQLDFGRDPDLTIANLPDDQKWTNLDLNMTEFLEDKSRRVATKSNRNARANDLILGSRAWTLFRNNKEVRAAATLLRNVDSSVVLTPKEQSEDIQYKGSFGDYNVFVHYGTYLDDGREKQFFDPGEALLIGKSIDGVRHFGAIKDRKAQLKAMPFFLKSWENEDPSHRYIMIQSAPLLVSYDPNAACLMQVA